MIIRVSPLKSETAPSLKIARSIIDPSSLVDLICNAYALTPPVTIRLVKAGDNDHYLVSSKNGKFVLRIYRYNKHWLQKESDYLFELELLTFLHKHQIPVSYPIQQQNGSFLGTLLAPEGSRYWALFSFAEGQKMKLDSCQCTILGKWIGKIHTVSNSFSPSYSRQKIDQNFLIHTPLKRIRQFLGRTEENRLERLFSLTQYCKNLWDQFSQIAPSDGWGIIGGDFHGENHFYKPDGNITLLDFDLCGFGWRAYDLAVFRWFLFGIYQKGKRPKNAESLWNAFLSGYTSCRSLTPQELDIIPMFVLLRQLWLMGSETTYPDLTLDHHYWDEMFQGIEIAQRLINRFSCAKLL